MLSWLIEPEDDIWLMELPLPMVSWLMVEWLMVSFDMLDEVLWANAGTAKDAASRAAAARVGTRSNIIGSLRCFQTH